MAIVGPTQVKTPFDASGIKVYKWTGGGNGQTGSALVLPNFPDRSVEITGTLGTGGNCTIQGSMNPDAANAVFGVLHDPQGGNLLLNAVGMIEAILEPSYLIRPVIGGDANTLLDVWLILYSGR
jgi:hypothetical protein